MEQLLKIIENFKNQKVLVVGDLMLDEYLWGEVDRISPEAPIPILDIKNITYLPGGAANTAYNLSVLGDKIFLVGIIGPEDKGKLLKEILEKKGIDIQGIFIDEKRKTTVKTRAIAKDQQMIRLDYEDKNPIEGANEQKILNFLNEMIKEVSAVIISDYSKGVVTESLAKNIIETARRNNVLCLVDSKAKDYQKYKNCNIAIPNEKELALALNLEIRTEGQFLEAGKMLLSHLSCDNVLVKRGAKGMTIFEKNGNTFSFPAINKQPVDVSGAGDTAIAVFTLALCAGANLKAAVIITSHACGIAVGKMGTAIALPEELEKSLKTNYEQN
ncbi:MAG: D-glycero-beta-D-manno-heptose-7-phosphate kinase [Candidatus Pacebacteria bacterium]|nr:D-glycero-beta-D-manno-heptose-7-phosphate kinase [Candidatus Paceibacterota bacterium]